MDHTSQLKCLHLLTSTLIKVRPPDKYLGRGEGGLRLRHILLLPVQQFLRIIKSSKNCTRASCGLGTLTSMRLGPFATGTSSDTNRAVVDILFKAPIEKLSSLVLMR